MRIHGFYGVVDGVADVAAAVALAERLLAGGAGCLQVRMKRASARRFLEVAEAVRAACRGIPFVVNDRLDIALAVGADAVHLGQDDLPLSAARGRLAVGVSTHTVAQAFEAARAGADYIGFGPVFPTTTKENPDPVQGLAALAEVVAAVAPLAVVAIGGITPARAPEVVAAGAHAICAISSVNGAADVAAAARSIAAAYGGQR